MSAHQYRMQQAARGESNPSWGIPPPRPPSSDRRRHSSARFVRAERVGPAEREIRFNSRADFHSYTPEDAYMDRLATNFLHHCEKDETLMLPPKRVDNNSAQITNSQKSQFLHNDICVKQNHIFPRWPFKNLDRANRGLLWDSNTSFDVFGSRYEDVKTKIDEWRAERATSRTYDGIGSTFRREPRVGYNWHPPNPPRTRREQYEYTSRAKDITIYKPKQLR